MPGRVPDPVGRVEPHPGQCRNHLLPHRRPKLPHRHRRTIRLAGTLLGRVAILVGLGTIAGVAGKGETLDVIPRWLIQGRHIRGASFGGVRGRDQVPEYVQRWLDGASCPALSEFSVPWVAAGSPDGWAAGLKWIDSKKAHEAAAGWSTLAGIVSMKPDAELDLDLLRRLLARVETQIHAAPNRVRYAMNAFVISVGGYVKPLAAEALRTGKAVGVVQVDMGDTSCKVPGIVETLGKIKARGALGKKRRTVKC